jgi:hypothetical protein
MGQGENSEIRDFWRASRVHGRTVNETAALADHRDKVNAPEKARREFVRKHGELVERLYSLEKQERT